MEKMAISKFKATCLAVMERVRVTRKPILITRFGEPVAEVIPPSAPERPEDWLGALKGTATMSDDLTDPVVDPDDWEANRS